MFAQSILFYSLLELRDVHLLASAKKEIKKTK